MMSRLWAAIKRMFTKKSTVTPVPVPAPPEERRDPLATSKPRLGLIIGHSKADEGAAMVKSMGGMQEYSYNKLIAAYARDYSGMLGIDIQIYTRDVGGIPGAYSMALKDKCDAIIELHFNSCDSSTVAGTETLCSTRSDDQAFARVVQEHVFKLSNGVNRGVKVLSATGRGAQSCYSAGQTPNCLIEPFFGSNPLECSRWLLIKKEYGLALGTAFKNWCIQQGMNV